MKSCTLTFTSLHKKRNSLSPHESFIARKLFPSNCGPNFSNINNYKEDIIKLIKEIKEIYQKNYDKMKDKDIQRKIIEIHHEHLGKNNKLYDYEISEKYIINGKYLNLLSCNWLNLKEVYHKLFDICLDIKSYFELEDNIFIDLNSELSPDSTPTIDDINRTRQKFWESKGLRRNNSFICLSAN